MECAVKQLEETPVKKLARIASLWSPDLAASLARTSLFSPSSHGVSEGKITPGIAPARRSSQPEIFDLADSDDEAYPQRGAFSCRDPSPKSQSGASTQDGTTSPDVPSGSEPESLAASHYGSAFQGDAWNLHDWDAQIKQSTQISPCHGVHALDGPQREVADAVATELQVDLESAMSRVMDQMSHWISQEMAFARTEIADHLLKACEQVQEGHAMKDENLRSAQVCLCQRVDQLERSADVQKIALEELSCRTADERRPSESRAPSSAVNEAARVGEARKCRLKFAEIEASIKRNSDDVGLLAEQCRELGDRCGIHDTEVENQICAVKRIETQLTTLEKTRLVEFTRLNKRFDGIDDLRRQSNTLVERANAHDATSKRTEAQLVAGKGTVLAVQEMVDTLVESVEAQLTTCKGDVSAVKDNLEHHQRSIEKLLQQSGHLAESVQAHAGAMQARDALIKKVAARMASLSTEHSECIAKLDERYDGLMNRVDGHETGIGKSVDSIKCVIQRLNNEKKERLALQAVLDGQLIEGLASHQVALQQNAVAAQSMDARLAACEKEYSQHSETVAWLNGQYRSLAGRVDHQESEIAGNIEIVKSVNERLTVEEKERLGIRANIDSQLAAIETLSQQSSDLALTFTSSQAMEARLDVCERESLLVHAQVHGHIERIEALQKHATSLAEQACANEVQIASNANELRGVEAQMSISETERFAELRVVCSRLESHEAQLELLPHQFRTARDDVCEKLADLKCGFRARMENMVESSCLCEALASHDKRMMGWVQDARRSHDVLRGNLSKWLEEHQTMIGEQACALGRHDEWMQHVARWLEQVRVREQGLTHVLCQVASNSSPELLAQLERALKVPQL